MTHHYLWVTLSLAQAKMGMRVLIATPDHLSFLRTLQASGINTVAFQGSLSRVGKYNPNSQEFPVKSCRIPIWSPEPKTARFQSPL